MIPGRGTRALFVTVVASSLFGGELVTSVSVPGSNLHVNLATQVGRPFDSQAVAKDVRYLWGLGRFEDIRVEAVEQDDGVAVTFHTLVAPLRMLREIRIEPHTFGLDIKLPHGTLMTGLRAHDIAMGAQNQLNRQGYHNARVDYQMKPAPGNQVDLRLRVDPGDALRVKQVRFEGDDAERADLRALRSRKILFWRLLPSYSQEAVDADVARIRSAYLSRGYYDADVRPGPVDIRGNNADVTIVVEPGKQSAIEPNLCRSLFAERREAQRLGILDFTAGLDAEQGATVELGAHYRVGRIEFTGNHHYKDAVIRGNFLLDEGQPFDEHMLRRSLANLNRTGMFESIDPRNVVVQPNEKTGLADVTVRLTERKRGSWNLSGPMGPATFAGPLQGAISSRLPPWGRGLFELSTYTVSLSILAFSHPLLPILNAPKAFVPILALERPYVPGEGWKSGFLVAPQLGWRGGTVGYAASQLQHRLMPLMAGDRGVETDLLVTVNREAGEATMACEPPKPRLGLLRTTGTLGLHFLGTLSGL